MTVTLITLLGILHFAAGGSRAVCPTQPIKVVEGENAALHCGLDPPVDLSRYTVDWRREDNQQFVYVYRYGRDDPGPVVDQYRGRTTINHEGLSRGIVTLEISSANLSDSGSYKCFVPKLKVSCVVHVIVEEKETKTDVSNTTGPAVEEVTETDDGVPKDQQNRTKRHDSSTTVPPLEEEPEPGHHDAVKRAAVWKTVLPVVVVLLLLLVAAALLLWKCGVIKKCMQQLEGERGSKDTRRQEALNYNRGSDPAEETLRKHHASDGRGASGLSSSVCFLNSSPPNILVL